MRPIIKRGDGTYKSAKHLGEGSFLGREGLAGDGVQFNSCA